MNDYIVWSKRKERFIKSDDVRMNLKTGELHGKHSDGNVEDWTAFKSIGKTDIEGNKIYADSSIVEFYLTLSHSEHKKIGFIKFNREDSCYEILVEDDYDGYDKYNFIDYEIRNLKIIGSIQEDKHLIGEK